MRAVRGDGMQIVKRVGYRMMGGEKDGDMSMMLNCEDGAFRRWGCKKGCKQSGST